ESSVFPTRVLSSIFTPATSAAKAGTASKSSTTVLKTILDPFPGERRTGAARGVALHVDRDRVHGDVRGGGLDVDGKGGGIAAQSLRTDAEEVDRLGEVALELRAFRIVAVRTEGAGRGQLGEMHAKVGGAADTDADNG